MKLNLNNFLGLKKLWYVVLFIINLLIIQVTENIH